jgi:translation initiation factor IF-3
VNEPRINDRIRAREVRLVDPDGRQLGIKPLPEALAIARELDLDLVEVAPQAVPPVCRVMDYGKFKFDAAQKARESRRKANNVGIKEMKYRPKIGAGDFDTKTRRVIKFLAEGHKVKITIMFRGREVYHPELGRKILDRIAESVDGNAKVETEARLDGRNMVMVLAPDKRALQAAAARGDRPESGGGHGQGQHRHDHGGADERGAAQASESGGSAQDAGGAVAENEPAAAATGSSDGEAVSSEAVTGEPESADASEAEAPVVEAAGDGAGPEETED